MATTDNRIALVENDTADIIQCQFQDLDITGYTFWLKVGYRNKALVKEAVITAAASGEFQFTFAYGELMYGTYACEILMQDPSGKQKTFQGFEFDIARRLKGTP